MSKRRFILRKLVDAENAAEAIRLDGVTPVHEVFIDEQKAGATADAIGFKHTEEPGWYDAEPQARRKR